MACAVFSRLIEVTRSKLARVIVIKIALRWFIGMGRYVKVPLVIESSLRVVLEWLLKRNY